MAVPDTQAFCPLTKLMMNYSDGASNSTARVSVMVYLHGVVSSLGILMNLLILWVVGFRVRRTVISIWVLNLAASDLLATASLPLFTVYMARGNTWTLSVTCCRLHSSVFFLNMFVSGFLLAAITLDRCLMVIRPIWAQNHRNVGLVGKVCGLLWVLAFLCTIPFYLFRDVIHQRSGQIQCYYNYARYLPAGDVDLPALCEARQEALAFMKLFLAFLLPLAVIVTGYVTVMVRLSRRRQRCSYRFVRLVVAAVVSFFLCWAPYHLFSVIEILAPQRSSAWKVAVRALPIAASISFLNAVFNPILYVFICPDLCSKIRMSLGAVMESVLVEDLGELVRRRSTAASLSTTEVPLSTREALPLHHLKEVEEK